METTVQSVEQLNAILPNVSWEWCAFLPDGQLRIHDDRHNYYTVDRAIWSHPRSPIRTSAHRLWKAYPAPWNDQGWPESEQPIINYLPIESQRPGNDRPDMSS